MNSAKWIVVAVLLSSAALSALLSITAWKRRAAAGPPATFLSLCMAGVMLYSFGYAMEVSRNTLAGALFWLRVEHVGIDTLAPLWLLFALCVSGKEKLLTGKWIAALFIVPALVFTANCTNAWHYLFYRNPHLTAAGPFLTFSYEMGPLYWLSMVYLNLCLVAATALFTMMLVEAAPSFRRQAALFFAGSLAPWIGMGLFLSGNSPYHLDIAPIAMSITGLIVSLGLLEFRVLDVVPMARDIVIEGMSDAVLVLDIRGRIVDANPAAAALAGLPAGGLIGLPATTTLPAWSFLVDELEDRRETLREVALNQGGILRSYDLTISPIRAWRGRLVGRLITLHDVSERKRIATERERLIGELQTALAHVKRLSGLLPICARCKKIRNDEGYWEQIEEYVRERSEADFTHGLCPDCAREMYPQYYGEGRQGSEKK